MDHDSSAIADAKAAIRREALARRDGLPADMRAAAAQAIAERVFPIAMAADAIVSGFMPLKSEINPIPLMRRLADAGAQLALPAIAGRGLPLTMRAYSFGQPLASGVWGIREPGPDAREVFPDIVIAPLLAFDRSRRRHCLRGAGNRPCADDRPRRSPRSRANRARDHRLPGDVTDAHSLYR